MSFKKCTLCDEILDIGCFLHCAEISTGLLAQQIGVHKVYVRFLGSYTVFEVTIANIGDEITLPAGSLNESAEVIASIMNPDDTVFVYNTGGTDYSCFRFELLLNF